MARLGPSQERDQVPLQRAGALASLPQVGVRAPRARWELLPSGAVATTAVGLPMNQQVPSAHRAQWCQVQEWSARSTGERHRLELRERHPEEEVAPGSRSVAFGRTPDEPRAEVSSQRQQQRAI